MRNTRPGTIQDAVARCYRMNGGLEATAADLGVAASTLSYGTEVSEARPGGLGVNYLDRLGRIAPQAVAPIAQHFAALAGGVFQPTEAVTRASLVSHSGVIAKEAGEAVAAIIGAAQQAGAGHRDAALREIDEAVRALLAAKADLLQPSAPIAIRAVA